MGKRSVEIAVTPRQRVLLERFTRSKKAAQPLVERCRVVLLSAAGRHNEAQAEEFQDGERTNPGVQQFWEQGQLSKWEVQCGHDVVVPLALTQEIVRWVHGNLAPPVLRKELPAKIVGRFIWGKKARSNEEVDHNGDHRPHKERAACQACRREISRAHQPSLRRGRE